MKRKLVYIGTAWATGLLCGAFTDFSHDFLFIPGLLGFLLIFKFVFKGRFKEFILIASAFIFALVFYRAYDALIYKKVIDYAGQEVSFIGRITKINDYAGDKSSYELKGNINEGVRCRIQVYTDSLECEVGDKAKFLGILKVPENTYLFESKSYYKSCGIYLQSDTVLNFSCESSGFSLTKLINSYREKVIAFIKSSLPEEESGFLISMIFADKSGIDEENRSALYSVGIGHILAVSGLHLMFFSRLVRSVLRRLKLGRKAQFIISEIAMIMFAMCCSMSISVVRAFFVLTIGYSAPLFFRKADSLNSICIALIFMTLPCPFYITNYSLVLSITGAFGAGVFAPYVTKNMKSDKAYDRLIKNVSSLLCIFSVVFPATVICFGEGAIISPLTNLLLTPLCVAALLLGMVSALFVFLKPVFLLKISGILCRIVLTITKKLYSINWLHVSFSDNDLKYLAAALAVLCIVGYFIHKTPKYTVTSVLISFAVFVYSAAYSNFLYGNYLKIAFLGENIGVVVISKGGRADIIDISGDRRNGDYVEKYIGNNNISSISNVFLCSESYGSSALYNGALSGCEVENVHIPLEYKMRSNMKICGCIPAYEYFKNMSVIYESYCIRINDQWVNIEYGDFKCTFTTDKNAKSNLNINTVLVCGKDGTVRIRSLQEGG